MADVQLIQTIIETYHLRQDYLRAAVRLELQAASIVRRIEPSSDTTTATAPLAACADELRRHLAQVYDPALVRLARQLPVYPWVKATRGFGDLSLAKIVGEAHDLSGYATHSRLWKRMGLAVMPDGTRQRKVVGEAALAHGYSPTRRSLMFLIGDGLIKQNEHYRGIYQARKAVELARDETMTRMFVHMRAHRYMEKRFLRDLWQAWQAAEAPNLLE